MAAYTTGASGNTRAMAIKNKKANFSKGASSASKRAPIYKGNTAASKAATIREVGF